MAELEGFERARPRARLGVGAAIVVALGALAVTVGVGVWRGLGDPAPVSTEATVAISTPPAPTPAEIYVHVSGAVREPGLYLLSEGARVVDAVGAAGGFAKDAEPGAINLARGVADGEQLVVPVAGEAPPAAAAPGGPAGGLVDLNTADAAALEELPGIGPALAARILAWREENGSFAAVDDLMAVSGIGPAVLEGIRDLATV
ncbi:ComEA family DNA-binding protein [Microbacterium sp. ZXX196]|uniref:ComEA family DNA-binding protein n=1 Tax=Microbacterium sp. ZXX196 TaxID=2609291 RepID=UPI0012BA1B64|nr:ComEA family DNA-binding protein [Microbacterium sp. ZXX196]MTE23803.1 competence protein ComEA [Microbacterium sp. ZXX196]